MKALDGPFAEAKELVGGYAVIDVHSKEEAVELGPPPRAAAPRPHPRLGRHGRDPPDRRFLRFGPRPSRPAGPCAPTACVVSCSRGRRHGVGVTGDMTRRGAGGDARGDDPTRAAIEAVWRLESTRLIAGLVRIVRDVGARRGPRAGRDRRGARPVAGDGHPRQPGSVAHDHGEAARGRHVPPPRAARRRLRRDRPRAVGGDRGGLRAPASTTSRTTCCG